MPGQPGAIRESRVEGRPRNPEVEKAWRIYAGAFEEWQRLLYASTASLASGYANAEDARMIALRSMSDAKDEALFEYFEIYDRDQREAFSESVSD